MIGETRLIPLTKGKFAVVSASDYDWLNQWKWQYTQSQNTGYAQRSETKMVNGVKKIVVILMHRHIINAPKGIQVDHRDLDGLHNWRDNLRLATISQNAANSPKDKGCSSKYKGVYWHKPTRKWRVQIKLNGKNIHLGRFSDEVAAAMAYNTAAIKCHGEFAWLNPIPSACDAGIG